MATRQNKPVKPVRSSAAVTMHPVTPNNRFGCSIQNTRLQAEKQHLWTTFTKLTVTTNQSIQNHLTKIIKVLYCNSRVDTKPPSIHSKQPLPHYWRNFAIKLRKLATVLAWLQASSSFSSTSSGIFNLKWNNINKKHAVWQKTNTILPYSTTMHDMTGQSTVDALRTQRRPAACHS